MIHDQFLYCRNCREVHHLTPFDRAPIYHLEGKTVREIVTDDRRQFADRHLGHEIEELNSIADDIFPNGRPSDPMKVRYVGVTNGQVPFVLRVSRKNIADPMTYKIIPRRVLVYERSEFL